MWRSKDLSEESIEPTAKPDNSFASGIIFSGTTIKVRFDGSCLK